MLCFKRFFDIIASLLLEDSGLLLENRKLVESNFQTPWPKNVWKANNDCLGLDWREDCSYIP